MVTVTPLDRRARTNVSSFLSKFIGLHLPPFLSFKSSAHAGKMASFCSRPLNSHGRPNGFVFSNRLDATIRLYRPSSLAAYRRSPRPGALWLLRITTLTLQNQQLD